MRLVVESREPCIDRIAAPFLFLTLDLSWPSSILPFLNIV